jgi:hypothetical protein
VLRRLPLLLAAFLSTSCLLEDPYFIDERKSLTNDEDDDSPRDAAPDHATHPGPDAGRPLEPEAEALAPPPSVVKPDDVLLEPSALPAEPEPAVDVDASRPEPVEPEPAPELTPPADAGQEPCEAGAEDCTSSPVCGNGVVELQEDCDGNSLEGETCYGQGFSGGALACSTACSFDTSACLGGPSCEAAASGDTGLVYEGDLDDQGNDVLDYSCSVGGRYSQDVTLSWTAPSAGCFEISVDSQQEIDTIIAVFEDCSIARELACDDEYGGADPESLLQFEADANTTYALAVDAYGPGDEASIEVTIAPCSSNVWSCGAQSYDDGRFCDCGCGEFDPDCADEDVDSCDRCGGIGACGYYTCEGVAEEQNWTCD